MFGNPDANLRLVELFDDVENGKELLPEELADVMRLVAADPVLSSEIVCKECVVEGVDEPRPVVAELPFCVAHVLRFFAFAPSHSVTQILED